MAKKKTSVTHPTLVVNWRFPDTSKFEKLSNNIRNLLKHFTHTTLISNLLKEYEHATDHQVIHDFFERFFCSSEFEKDRYLKIFSYFTNNTVLQDKKGCLVIIRLNQHPLFQDSLPKGLTLGVASYIKFANDDNTAVVLTPENFVVTHAHSQPMRYERGFPVRFCVQTDAKSEPTSNREIRFTNSILHQLPKIDRAIATQFHSWFNYLDFENNFDQMQTVGLRYLDWQYDPLSETIYFLTICNDAKYNEYVLNYYIGYELNFLQGNTSQFPFKFAAKNYEELPFANYFEGTAPVEPENIIREDDFAARAHELPQGILQSYRACKSVAYEPTQEKLFIQDCQNAIAASKKSDARNTNAKFAPQEGLIYNIIGVHLNHDNLALLRQMSTAKPQEHPVLKRIPHCGFMTGQVIGHIILNNRQRRNLENLSNGTNLYAPYLAQYLFDIKNAYRPQQLPRIKEWFNPNLNVHQKLAVQKMLADTNLCLIQGPPGTGKTTVIAEAILQLVAQGQKVLLSSQSHDAIDNAISRVKSNPDLRGIRLANYSSRITGLGENYKGENSLISYYQTLKQHFQAKHDRVQDRRDKVATYSKRVRDAIAQYTDLFKEKANDKEFVKRFILDYRDLEYYRKEYEPEYQKFDFSDESYTEVIPYMRSFWKGETDFLPKDKVVELLNLINAPLIELTSIPHRPELSPPALEKEGSKLNWIKRYCIELRDYAQNIRNHLNANQNLQEQIDQAQEQLAELFQQEELSDADLVKLQELKKRLKHLKESLDPHATDNTTVPSWSEWMAQHVEPLCPKDTEGRYAYSEIAALKLPSRVVFRYIEREMKEHPQVIKALDKYVYQLLNQSFEKFMTFLEQPEEAQNYVDGIIFYACTEQQLELIYGDVFTAFHTCAQLLDESRILSFKKADYEKFTAVLTQKDTFDSAVQNEFNKRERINFITVKNNQDENKKLKAYKFGFKIIEALTKLAELTERLIDVSDEKGSTEMFYQGLMSELLNDPTAQAQNDWNDLHRDFIEDANLVAITCNEGEETYNRNNLSSFDVVIIDEVSKVTPIELLQPLMRARRAILVGDHNQLPPTYADKYVKIAELESATAHYELQKYGQQHIPDYAVVSEENQKKYTQLYTDSLFKRLYEEADPILKERLTEQYRMHPTIMDIDNMFYDGELTCGNPDKERNHHVVISQGRHAIIDNKTHMIWVDTTKDEQNLDYVSEHNNVNRVEARLIAKTLYEMEQALARNPEFTSTKKVDVGVVSFYQPQCQAIRREIRAILDQHNLKDFHHISPDINSVIRFQGKEKPIILLSLVKNLPQQYDRTMQGSTAHISSPNFINVAISRAQNLLMIFGAKRMLENRAVRMNDNPHGDNHKMVYHNIFNYIAEHSSESTREYTAREFSLNFRV